MARKSFREKMQMDHGLPKLVPLPGDPVSGTLLVPSPAEVAALMRVRKGKLTTINQIREALAERHGATRSCPTATGIFASLAARAAAEEEATGGKPLPYWRTLKLGGEINPKYPGGCEGQAERLRGEGHEVVQRGRRWLVVGYEKKLR